MRYNRQRFTGVNNENGGPTQSVKHSGDSLVNTDTVTASVTNTFSRRSSTSCAASTRRTPSPASRTARTPKR